MIRIALRLPRALTALSNHLVNENDSAELALNELDWETAKSTLYLLEQFTQGNFILFSFIFGSSKNFNLITATDDLSADYFGVIGQLNIVFIII
jgi:hypothetical protein